MPVQIAFNAVPQIADRFQDNGYTKEEMKMVWETQKILDERQYSCESRPAFECPCSWRAFGSRSHRDQRRSFPVAEARALLRAAPGRSHGRCCTDGGYPTAVGEAAGTDPVFVGRITQRISPMRNGLDPLGGFADNVRKGAALNSVQIAELLLEHLQFALNTAR